jgi:hypothetical protein
MAHSPKQHETTEIPSTELLWVEVGNGMANERVSNTNMRREKGRTNQCAGTLWPLGSAGTG